MNIIKPFDYLITMMYNQIGDNMKALVTGASSGIGKDIAIRLSSIGYDVILASRRKEELKKVSSLCTGKTEIYQVDLSNKDECVKMFNKYKNIDILVNNAGYGMFGNFYDTDLEKELNMIDVNIKAVHILTKLYLKEMMKNNKGRILNVASSAAFSPGPLMATYYSSKSYVLRLTVSINEELRRSKSNVKVSVLCPGPVDTNFNNVAGVNFALKGLSSSYVAKYAINKMFKNKLIIIPGLINKISVVGCKLLPLRLLAKIDYNIQRRKEK